MANIVRYSHFSPSAIACRAKTAIKAAPRQFLDHAKFAIERKPKLPELQGTAAGDKALILSDNTISKIARKGNCSQVLSALAFGKLDAGLDYRNSIELRADQELNLARKLDAQFQEVKKYVWDGKMALAAILKEYAKIFALPTLLVVISDLYVLRGSIYNIAIWAALCLIGVGKMKKRLEMLENNYKQVSQYAKLLLESGKIRSEEAMEVIEKVADDASRVTSILGNLCEIIRHIEFMRIGKP